MERHRLHPEMTRRPASPARRAALVAVGLLLAGTVAFAQGDDPFATLELELVAEGFTAPVALTDAARTTSAASSSSRPASIHILDERRRRRSPTPFLDVRDRLVTFRPGSTSAACSASPSTRTTRRTGASTCTTAHRCGTAGAGGAQPHRPRLRVPRLGRRPDRADPESERVVLEVDQPAFNHNGGQDRVRSRRLPLHRPRRRRQRHDVGPFHPPQGNAQDITTLLGSDPPHRRRRRRRSRLRRAGRQPLRRRLRTRRGSHLVRHRRGLRRARRDLPVGRSRNPFRFSFDRETGDLWIGDVGQGMWEEHNRVTEPGNLGWRIMEGDQWFDPEQPLETARPKGPRPARTARRWSCP
jgi:hypothetical protein